MENAFVFISILLLSNKPVDCLTNHDISAHFEPGNLITVTGTFAYLYQNDSLLNSYWLTPYTNTTWTTQVDDQQGQCYEFVLSISTVETNFEQTAFMLTFDDKPISLINQTHLDDDFTTSIQFCSDLFRNNTPSDFYTHTYNYTYSTNTLSITFESYPTKLTLEIYNNNDPNTVYYKNEFSDTTQDSTKYSKYNNTIIIPNIQDGCYDIYMIDEYYDDLESSLNHIRYIITFNNNTIKYGGYYSSDELTSFCTNDSLFCVGPNSCSNVTNIDISDTTTSGSSFKNYYASVISGASNANLNFYGSNSFENGYILDASFTDGDKEFNCNGVFSCSNATFAEITTASKNLEIFCQGFESCSGLRLIDSFSVSSTQLTLYWYVTWVNNLSLCLLVSLVLVSTGLFCCFVFHMFFIRFCSVCS